MVKFGAAHSNKGSFRVLKERLPWWVKMIAKAFLARIPLSGVLKQKLDIFRHGQMDDPAYAARIFAYHLARFQKPLTPWTCLELGSGDSLFTALLAKAAGAEKIWLVDAGDFAATSIDSFKTLARQLIAEGKPVPDLSACQTRAEVLTACNAVYLTNGLAGLKTIPDATVDFIFSNAVLEHVRKADMPETLAELARIMKPSGLQSHSVDLRDHLQNGLNNLRFSDRLWESGLFAHSGFYTNRIRFSGFFDLFKRTGFHATELARTSWDDLPTPRDVLHPAFQTLRADDLKISTFDVKLEKENA